MRPVTENLHMSGPAPEKWFRNRILFSDFEHLAES
jgi:hypothetical protein